MNTLDELVLPVFLSSQKLPKVEKVESDAVGDAAQNEENKKQDTLEPTPETPSNHDLSDKSKVAKVESEKKVTKASVIDKELLQACYCCLKIM